MKNFIFILLFASLFNQSYATIVVLNGLTHVHTAATGNTLEGRIKLKNEGNKQERFVVYKNDFFIRCGQTDTFSDSLTHERSIKNWLNTSVNEKVLEGGEEYELVYSITVPKDIKENGTYWTTLMVEPGEPLTTKEENGLNIKSKVRYAVQVVLDLNGYEAPKLVFNDVIIKKSGDLINGLEVTLRNDGLYSTRAKIVIELYDETGKKINTIEGKSRRLYPSMCGLFEIEIKDLPKGKFDGVIIADNGKDLFGSNISLEIK